MHRGDDSSEERQSNIVIPAKSTGSGRRNLSGGAVRTEQTNGPIKFDGFDVTVKA